MKIRFIVLFICIFVLCGCGTNKFHREEVPLGRLISDPFDSEEYTHGEVCIKEIEEEEYNLLNGLNSIIVLKKDNTIRKYCLLQFTYYDAEGNEMKIDIKDLECSLGTVNIYHGNIVFEDNEKPSVGITMIIGFTALRIITNTDSYESIILKLY